MDNVIPLKALSERPLKPLDGGDRSTGVASLLREVVGPLIREERIARAERLVDVAERAGVSVPFLSEIERGLKDPSSEVLSAVVGALELPLGDLLARAADAAIGRDHGSRCLAA